MSIRLFAGVAIVAYGVAIGGNAAAEATPPALDPGRLELVAPRGFRLTAHAHQTPSGLGVSGELCRNSSGGWTASSPSIVVATRFRPAGGPTQRRWTTLSRTLLPRMTGCAFFGIDLPGPPSDDEHLRVEAN